MSEYVNRVRSETKPSKEIMKLFPNVNVCDTHIHITEEMCTMHHKSRTFHKNKSGPKAYAAAAVAIAISRKICYFPANYIQLGGKMEGKEEKSDPSSQGYPPNKTNFPQI